MKNRNQQTPSSIYLITFNPSWLVGDREFLIAVTSTITAILELIQTHAESSVVEQDMSHHDTIQQAYQAKNGYYYVYHCLANTVYPDVLGKWE